MMEARVRRVAVEAVNSLKGLPTPTGDGEFLRAHETSAQPMPIVRDELHGHEAQKKTDGFGKTPLRPSPA